MTTGHRPGVDVEDLRRAIGSRIRARRSAAELSLDALAELADVNATHLGRIERAEKTPSVMLILKLAGALEVAPSDLLIGTSKKGGARSLSAPKSSVKLAGKRRSMTARIKRLSGDQLDTLGRVMDALRM